MMTLGAMGMSDMRNGSSREHVLQAMSSALQDRTFDAMAAIAPAFLLAWAECAFSTVEPTHRLAASLMATNCPGEYVDTIGLPWRCFAIAVPIGVLDGTPDFMLVLQTLDGKRIRVGSFSEDFFALDDETSLGEYCARDLVESDEVDEEHRRMTLLMGRLIVGTCIEMMTPKATAFVRSTPTTPRIKRGEPRSWTYRLTRDVRMDVRSHVAAFARGDRTSLTVQSIVRGHWKSQPYGTGSALRKWIHIEPYWRGPEDAPIAVRAHRPGDRSRPGAKPLQVGIKVGIRDPEKGNAGG